LQGLRFLSPNLKRLRRESSRSAPTPFDWILLSFRSLDISRTSCVIVSTPESVGYLESLPFSVTPFDDPFPARFSDQFVCPLPHVFLASELSCLFRPLWHDLSLPLRFPLLITINLLFSDGGPCVQDRFSKTYSPLIAISPFLPRRGTHTCDTT